MSYGFGYMLKIHLFLSRANFYQVLLLFGSKLCCVFFGGGGGGWIFTNTAGSVEHNLHKIQVLNDR
jgi:hypothetical protein